MARIGYVDYLSASDEVKFAYNKLIKENGRVTNMKNTLLQDITAFKAYQEWYPLYKEVEAITGELGAQILSYSISTQNECSLCSLYFSKALLDKGYNPSELILTPQQELLGLFGSSIAKDPKQISDELFAQLKSNFSTREIVVLTAFAGQMIATNVFNSALQIDIDENLLG